MIPIGQEQVYYRVFPMIFGFVSNPMGVGGRGWLGASNAKGWDVDQSTVFVTIYGTQ